LPSDRGLMMAPTSPARPDGADADLVGSVVAAIRERISTGQFPVGTWLRQEKLATELGISRMPVREALRRLQAAGTIEILANRGARVRLPSVRDLSEVYEIRGVLEGHAAAAASQLITSEQLARLRHAHELFLQVIADLEDGRGRRQDQRRPSWHEANSLFHGVIVEASGNRNLGQVIEGLHQRVPFNLSWLALGNDIRLLRQNAAEHGRILAAVDAGQADRARTLTMAHARRARELMVRKLDELELRS
jgi:DNA-binding GntR family transcriptional regulator